MGSSLSDILFAFSFLEITEFISEQLRKLSLKAYHVNIFDALDGHTTPDQKPDNNDLPEVFPSIFAPSIPIPLWL